MNKDDELVLVVPSDIIFKDGKWQGFKTDNLEHYVDLIKNNCQFKRRGDVENDPSFQQIIPYMLFSHEDKFFAYKYIKNAGETRLINNDYQLGIGGHINRTDITHGGEVLEQGMKREWEEEVDFRGNFLQKKLVGIINDESRPVEQVHLGLVYHFVGDNPNIDVKETDKMEGKLFDLKDIAENISHSPWMNIVYNHYLKNLLSTKKIIGVVGEIGSGKDTFCQYVKENYKNVYFLRFSDALTETLKIFFDSIKREDQQWLSSQLREKFGGDVLVNALIKKVNNIKDGIIILNGVRRPSDFTALQELGGKIVYITADEKKRWERVVIRKEKADDDVPFERFLELCNAEAEQQIPLIGKDADFKIDNNGSKDQLFSQIKTIFGQTYEITAQPTQINKNNIGKGKFFVFEGIDGCGKSTQTKLLADYFKQKGFEVEKIDFPQHGQRSSAMVDDYLTGKYGSSEEVGPKVASVFYATDRYDASFKIKKWLDEGKIVISDRYLVSNIGHQGGKIKGREEWKDYVNWLYNLEYNVFGIPKPDYTFILKTSAEFSLKLANNITDGQKKERRAAYLGDDRKQDIHEKDRNHLANALNSYLMAAEEFPNDFRVIECLEGGELLSPDVINKKIINTIEENNIKHMSQDRRIYTLPNNLMPEVKAVTFAKCSRSADPFDKIAAELTEEKSAEFNEKWVVGFGHSSIAEHAVISLAIENVSNIATKVIEDSRLASFTEKSSRYQIFNKDKLYLPENVMNSELREVYLDAVNSLMDVYEQLTEPMMNFVKQKYPKPADQDEKLYNMISKARACDNLRYLLPTATLTNLGMTINTRELEHLIVKLLSHPMKEMQDIGTEIKTRATETVPTLIKFANKNKYIFETKEQLKKVSDWELGRDAGNNEAVTIVNYDPLAINKLVTGLLYPYSDLSYEEISQKVRHMTDEKKERIIDEALKRRAVYDQPLRELEHIYYTFDILMDYGAFRDVQRHRMCTQSNQPVTIVHGYDLPPEIREAGFEEQFKQVVEKAADAYQKIYEKFPDDAQYVVPMCFRKRVLITWNLRELHHFISLRSGKKGHASYRRIAQECWRKLNEIQPLLARYIKVDMDEMSVSWAASLENKDFYYNPYAARVAK
jgi:thymidylate synthase ThyX/predicted NUDIX family phosphoesterase/thymidylate kinase